MNVKLHDRRRFLRELGLTTAALPFISGLPSLRAEGSGIELPVAKRFIVFFTPNGTLPDEFWPEKFGRDIELQLKPMLSALEPYRNQMLMLK
ncbi:MAG: DUF1552 domain-containing protein, partial [Planctomycetota bacterium]